MGATQIKLVFQKTICAGLITKANVLTLIVQKITIVHTVGNGVIQYKSAGKRNIAVAVIVTIMLGKVMLFLHQPVVETRTNYLTHFVSDILHYAENFDLDSVVTPVDADRFKQLLIQSKFDKKKTEIIYSGFKRGFDLGYQGDKFVRLTAANLKLRVGSPVILWNKIIKEVKLK